MEKNLKRDIVFVYCLYQKYHLQLSSSIQLIVFSFCWFPLLHEKFLFDVFDLCICFLVSLVWSSIQFTSSVMSDSLWPHEPQHASPLCPSPTPRVHPTPCPFSRWCHPAISSSVILFSTCPQSFPASGCFQMSQLFTWGGQSIGVSASTSVLPMNTQDWSPLGCTGWISLQSKRLSESSPTPQFKSNNYSVLSFLYSPTLNNIHDHWRNHSLD